MINVPVPVGTSNLAEPVSTQRPGRRGPRRLTTVLINAGLLTAAIASFASHELGATWHSIIGIAVLGVVGWHVISQRRWITSAARRRMRHPDRVLVVYNAVLVSMFAAVNISGFPVWFWDVGGVVLTVHTVTGVAFLLMVFGHLALNGRRLIAKLRRHRGGRGRAGTPRPRSAAGHGYRSWSWPGSGGTSRCSAR